MFEIYDIISGVSLLGGYTTASAARSAALRIFPDRMWGVRPVKG